MLPHYILPASMRLAPGKRSSCHHPSFNHALEGPALAFPCCCPYSWGKAKGPAQSLCSPSAPGPWDPKVPYLSRPSQSPGVCPDQGTAPLMCPHLGPRAVQWLLSMGVCREPGHMDRGIPSLPLTLVTQVPAHQLDKYA